VASDDAAELAKDGPADVVVMAVKTWQVRGVSEQVSPAVGDATVFLPLQNGVEAPEHIAAVHGEAKALGGSSRVICAIREPGVIDQDPFIQEITFGELDNRVTDRVRAIEGALREAGVTPVVPEHTLRSMWEKFVFISTISGLGAVTREPVGVFRSVPETRELLVRAIAEGAAAGRGRGVPLDPGYEDRVVRFIDTTPADMTLSMQRDIMAGRPSELEAQSGAVVRIGREVGVETPVHGFLYAALLPMERAARGETA
ncbi:MAG: 2-dehydropantoate 2-reductase, partial [Planctomycetota bacterium]